MVGFGSVESGGLAPVGGRVPGFPSWTLTLLAHKRGFEGWSLTNEW
jgi:hypothetical protein